LPIASPYLMRFFVFGFSVFVYGTGHHRYLFVSQERLEQVQQPGLSP
jgi:hypothetical protein